MARKISLRIRWYDLWLIGLLAGTSGPVSAQQPVQLEFDHIQQAQGLSSNIVNCIMQDRSGYLWIGTYGGLNRFDGSHFTVFKTDRRRPGSLGNNVVHDIGQDQAGNLWLATDDGISRYNGRTGQFRMIRSGGGKVFGQCRNILCDRTGKIWFSSVHQGLFLFDPETNQTTSFQHVPAELTSLSSDEISKNGLLEDPHRNGLWITTRDKGLNYFDIESGQFINYRNNPDKLAIFRPHDTSSLALDSTTHLIFADNTDQRILICKLVTKTVTNAITLASQIGRPAFPMATIVVDRSHNLWACSWQYSMFAIRAAGYRGQEFFHDDAEKTSIAGDFFWTGWQQNDGTIWFGTVNGISYTNPEKTFYHVHNLARQHPALANGRGLSSFLEEADGNWWLTSAEGELLHYRPTTSRLAVYKLSKSVPDDYRFGLPMIIAGFGQDELYICQTRSIDVFNKRTRTVTPFFLPPMVFNHATDLIAIVRQGDWLWLFGTSDVVFSCHLPSKKWRTHSLPFGTGTTRLKVISAGLDKTGRLWADVLSKGFIWFAPKDGRFVACPVQPPITGFTDHYRFAVDARNRLWKPISGYGLVEFDPGRGTYRTWTEQDGLCSNEGKAACTDAYGQIWMASFNNVSIVNPARSSVQNFTLPLTESNINYVDYMFPLRNGNILTTLKNYVVEFMPNRVNRQPAPASVLISTLALPDTTISIGAGDPMLRLGVDENDFSISYSVLNRARQTYTYFYYLDGYNDDWVKADARTVANYTKLPGGDYTFRVKAVAGNTETSETKLAIHIATVFYNTGWFRAALFAFMLALIYWFYQYRTRQVARLHHFQIQMTRLEHDKTQIQYQNLINHLNPHFLFNSLTSLNSLILTKPGEASLFLRKLSVIYRYILQNKDSELVSLQDELTFTQHYIDLQTARFGDGLQISLNIGTEYLTRRIVPVTIQNLLENATKHNIVSDDDPLRIRIYTAAETLFVMNTLQPKGFVETSNKQGLASLKSLYGYLSRRQVSTTKTATHFTVAVPLL
ncbi:ligand-binding sensor domain-containing protein [Spirosoma arcticum]